MNGNGKWIGAPLSPFDLGGFISVGLTALLFIAIAKRVPVLNKLT